MLLKEMWSAIGAPKQNQDEIDWLDDLRFYIDNNDTLLNKYFFPAVEKHKQYKDHPQAFKLYIRPVERCCEQYCNEFQIDSKSDKFPKEKLIELAKRFATEQGQFIQRGDYEA